MPISKEVAEHMRRLIEPRLEYDFWSAATIKHIPSPPPVRICQHCRRQTSASTYEGCGAPRLQP